MVRRDARSILSALGVVGGGGIATGIAIAAVHDPESLQGITVALFLAFLLFVYVSRRPGQTWARGNWGHYVAGAIACRFLAGLAHLAVAFYLFGGGMDFVGLHYWVRDTAQRLIRGSLDVERYGVLDAGGVTLLIAPFTLLLGTSIVGMMLISGLFGFIGSYLFLRSFQIAGPPDGDVRFLARILFFLPGFVFWGSLFGKDSVTLLCLGLASYCVARLTIRLEIGPAVGLGVTLAVTTLIRPHVAAPLGAAIGVSWLLSRASSPGPGAALVPVRLMVRTAILALLVIIPTVLLSSLISAVSLEAIYKDLARRHYALSAAGDDGGFGGLGSSLPPRLTGDSPWEFIEYLPEGFLTFIFRPLPFDAHNMQAVVASMEGVLLVGIVLWRRRQLWRSLRTAFSNPYLMFSITYFFLATTTLCYERNLGLIARHKIMVLPYLMIMLAVPLTKPRRVENGTRALEAGALAASSAVHDREGSAS